jgi:hypothetical protein
LRDLLDVLQLCSKYAREVDWRQLIERFKIWNAQTALACHVLAGHELLGIPIPSEFQVNSLARVLHSLAMWQIDHPQLASVRVQLLRPVLQLRRSLSSAPLRKQLRQNIRDPAWLSRQLWFLSGRRPG